MNLDDLLGQQQHDQQEASMREMMRVVKLHYDTAVSVGFTPEQAFELSKMYEETMLTFAFATKSRDGNGI